MNPTFATKLVLIAAGAGLTGFVMAWIFRIYIDGSLLLRLSSLPGC
jgi:hypothetical protein